MLDAIAAQNSRGGPCNALFGRIGVRLAISPAKVSREKSAMSKKTATPGKSESHLVVFQEKAIRRTWHNEEWWFAIVDVVAVLTDSVQPEGYVKDLRRRDKELARGWGQIATAFGLKPKAVCSGSIALTGAGSNLAKMHVTIIASWG